VLWPEADVPGAEAGALEPELEQAVARTAVSPTVTPAISGLRILTRLFSLALALR
jgi:hypothetical protein